MSDNQRIIYSCQAVAIDGVLCHGVQSIGITTNFNLEQVFELGQLSIYENIEGIPDVEVTLEKVIDGYPLLYLMATTGVTGSSASGLVARSKQQANLTLGIFGEEYGNIDVALDNSGNSEVEVLCSGMYVSSVSYTLGADGNFTESLTLVGNNKQWLSNPTVGQTPAVTITDEKASGINGNDSPWSLVAGSGGIQRREDFRMKYSILPVGIRGVNGSGIGNGLKPVSEGQPVGASGNSVHLQSVSISTDFSREDILELGRKNPFFRPAGFPIEVTCEIEAVTSSGDFINAFEDGDPALYNTSASGNNTQEENIFFALRGGMSFDLGRKNRLQSISYGGGDATGGNVTCSYSYSNFNDLDVKQYTHNNKSVMGFATENNPEGTDLTPMFEEQRPD